MNTPLQRDPAFDVEHHDSLYDAIMCHLPYGIFSVALGIICLSVLMYAEDGSALMAKRAHRLFHTLHFMHILFAGTGVVLTFRKYSQSVLGTLMVGAAVPAVFCTLSDAIMPFLGGKMLELDMQFHWCFVTHFTTIAPFLFAGIMNGWILSKHTASRYVYYSLGSHFAHIFISSLASIFYFVSFGLAKWWHHLGFLFLFLIIAVVIPCTLADLVVPSLCGRMKKARQVRASAEALSNKHGCCSGKHNAKHTN